MVMLNAAPALNPLQLTVKRSPAARENGLTVMLGFTVKDTDPELPPI
jgi:hypothetical protein